MCSKYPLRVNKVGYSHIPLDVEWKCIKWKFNTNKIKGSYEQKYLKVWVCNQ